MADIIKQLPSHVADLIAAGEVVERPGSAVKELLENSVDAGAGKITLEIYGGGMTFIRVTDDGKGMSPVDAEAAFLRHATSKIADERDLERIGTLGFRGEALAAIASVSRIDLLTRERGRLEGTSLSLEAGPVVEKLPAGCPEGTTIVIRDLFYNTPARMKYMKRDSAEAANVTQAAQKQALAHPGVAFRFIRDGAEVFRTSGNGSLKDCVYNVLGREFALGLTELKSEYGGMSLSGFVTRPTAAKGSRGGQYFFINERPIRSRVLSSALEEGCKTRIMSGKYPGCVISITIKPTALDVNVHPAKSEVRFVSEKEVFDLLYYAVLSVMGRDEGRPEVKPRVERYRPEASKREPTVLNSMSIGEFMDFASKSAAVQPPVSVLPRDGGAKYEPPKRALEAEPETRAKAEPEKPARRAASEQASETFKEPETASRPPKEERPRRRFIGEALNTYIVVEEGEALLLIDKHAAHERILFEKLRSEKGETVSQLLLTPLVIAPSGEEKEALLKAPEIVENLGFGVEDFGQGSLIVRRIPALMDIGDAERLLEEIAEGLLKGKRETPEGLREKLLYTVACKGAIKAGRASEKEELEALAEQVLSRDDIRYCPHGRPIVVSMTRQSLDRQFGRA